MNGSENLPCAVRRIRLAATWPEAGTASSSIISRNGAGTHKGRPYEAAKART